MAPKVASEKVLRFIRPPPRGSLLSKIDNSGSIGEFSENFKFLRYGNGSPNLCDCMGSRKPTVAFLAKLPWCSGQDKSRKEKLCYIGLAHQFDRDERGVYTHRSIMGYEGVKEITDYDRELIEHRYGPYPNNGVFGQICPRKETDPESRSFFCEQ